MDTVSVIFFCALAISLDVVYLNINFKILISVFSIIFELPYMRQLKPNHLGFNAGSTANTTIPHEP